jgi:hypothetical protein
MTLRITIFFSALIFTACATRKDHIEVVSKLCWHVHDYAGSPGSTNYHVIRDYWVTNRYAPFIISQGVPFTMDFAQQDRFTSPDTQKTEHYFDGVMARMRVTVSNTTAFFAGHADYHLHLGVTSSYDEDDKSFYGETLRSYSTRFSGTCTMGHEMHIGAGEDINDEPVVSFTFQPSTSPLSKFSREVLDESRIYESSAKQTAVSNLEYPITEGDKSFLAQVVNAVQKKDVAWIAQHMLYPLCVTNSNNTQLVKTEKEFEKILSREITDSISAKIVDAAQQPIFKNWRGVMIGDGILWLTEYGSDAHGPWTQGILAIGNFAYQPKEEEQLMRVVGPYPDSSSIKRCLLYWTANFSTNAANHFYVGATQPAGGFAEALVYWKEERTILDYSGLAEDAPKGAEIEAWRHPLKLDRDTVDTPEEIGGSNYLETHRTWLDWMDQCLSRGREYVISLDEARRLYPPEKIPDGT